MKDSNQETRVEFKQLLDFTSNSVSDIYNLQKILNQGPSRDVIVRKNEIQLRMNKSGKMYNWDPSDPRTAVTCLVAVGEYEPLETRVLTDFARKSKIVIDVGANVGYYGIELAGVLPSDGKILSFEPILTTFVQLEQNIRLNNLQEMALVYNLGLSDKDETTTMYLPRISGSSAASARNLHPDEDFLSHEARMSSLDKIFPTLNLNSCDLIKIDVEGGELAVIRGAINTIERFKPVIFAELLRKWSQFFAYNPNIVLELLQGLNYVCFGISPEFRRIEHFLDTDIETNFIFIHQNQLIEAKNIFDGIAI